MPHPPTSPRNPLVRLARRLDDALYAAESAVVTLFVVLMTLMVSADVVQRRVSDPKSKVGSLVARIAGVDDPATLQFMEETGGNLLAGALLILLVAFGFYSAERQRARDGEAFEPMRVVVGAAVGVVAIGATAYLVGHPDVPSRHLFASLFTLVGVAYAAKTFRARPSAWPLRIAVALAGAAGLVALALELVPEGYTWSKKVSLLLLMWVAFLGASMCAHDGKHLRLEALARLVPERIAPFVEALGAIVTVLLCAFFAWLVGVEIFGPGVGLRAMGEQIEMTEIPAWVRIFSAVVGFSILAVRYVGVAVSALAGGSYGKPRSELEEVLEAAEVKS